MAQVDAIRICSEALLLVGEKPIDSMEGDGASEVAARTFYAPTVRSAIAAHPWTFARRYVTLNRLAAAPLGPWSAAYQRPAETLEVRGMFIRGAAIPFEGSADTLLCNADATDAVDALTIYQADETLWHEPFRQAVMFRLAQQFALSLTENISKAETMSALADRELRNARTVNGQNTAPPILNLDGLLKEHR